MPKRRPVQNNYILIVFDSCRYDSFVRARPRVMKKLGAVERRWSYASWTSPSHYNLLIGLLPHKSPRHVYASEYYKTEFLKFNERLGADDLKFASLVPRLYLPLFLKESLGYRTHAR
ncbi:MAG TPA: metalloenzyme, partial [Bryobacteraceae bacterium]